jgi:hypothetical protein
MAERYDWLRLRADHRDARALLEALQQHTLPRWEAAGVAVWGVWQGLFGIAANELLVMTATSGPESGAPPLDRLPSGAAVAEALTLRATVRPAHPQPLQDPGLYVFRFFDVLPGHVDEVVALSSEAWKTFEASDRYRSRPCGLFRPHGAGPDRMLLVTWYDGFDSWEVSRTPAPEARDRFARRHALTTGTVAYATRLVVPET